MIIRALKLYGFVFIYGLIIMSGLVALQLIAFGPSAYRLFSGASFYDKILSLQSLIITLMITWGIIGFCATVSWIMIQKIHVFSFVLAGILIVAFVYFYLTDLISADLASWPVVFYATMLINAMVIAGWFGKQTFDVHGRMRAISVAGLGAGAKIWGMVLCLLLISTLIVVLYSGWPGLVGIYFKTNDPYLSLADILLPLSVCNAILLCFVLSIYFGITLMRKRQLLMVQFTYISICTSLVLFLVVGIYSIIAMQGMPISTILLIKILPDAPSCISAICGACVGLSCAFWCLSRVYKTKV